MAFLEDERMDGGFFLRRLGSGFLGGRAGGNESGASGYSEWWNGKYDLLS